MGNTEVNNDALCKIPRNDDTAFNEMGFYWISILINQYMEILLNHPLML